MRTRLNASQLAELQAVLLQRKADIEQRLQQVHGGQTRAEHARTVLLQDGDDAPQRSSDREVDLALSDMGAVDLARIQAALDRMDAGVYVFAMSAAKKSGLPGCNWSRRLPIACVASPVGSKRPARPSLTACNQNAQNQNRPCKLRLLQPV